MDEVKPAIEDFGVIQEDEEKPIKSEKEVTDKLPDGFVCPLWEKRAFDDLDNLVGQLPENVVYHGKFGVQEFSMTYKNITGDCSAGLSAIRLG